MQTLLSPPTALWCSDQFVANIDGPGLQCRYTIERPVILLGSSPRCDIVLPLRDEVTVSLVILVTDDRIHWIDLASPTGQWRSGAFNTNGCLVWRGYHLDLNRIRSEELEPKEHAACSPGPEDRPTAVPVFDVSLDGDRAVRAKLTRTLTLVGQSDRCRLRHQHRLVAAEHALFFVHNRETWLIDLLSKSGTRIDGDRAAVQRVNVGQTISIGKLSMRLLRWSDRQPLDVEPPSTANYSPAEPECSPSGPAVVDRGDVAALRDTAIESHALTSTILGAIAGVEKQSAVEATDIATDRAISDAVPTVSDEAPVAENASESTEPTHAPEPLRTTSLTVHLAAPEAPTVPKPTIRLPPPPDVEKLLNDPVLKRLIDIHQQDRRAFAFRCATAVAIFIASITVLGVAYIGITSIQ